MINYKVFVFLIYHKGTLYPNLSECDTMPHAHSSWTEPPPHGPCTAPSGEQRGLSWAQPLLTPILVGNIHPQH